jgi:hypothetical protein
VLVFMPLEMNGAANFARCLPIATSTYITKWHKWKTNHSMASFPLTLKSKTFRLFIACGYVVTLSINFVGTFHYRLSLFRRVGEHVSR